jgi:hypothetical protein
MYTIGCKGKRGQVLAGSRRDIQLGKLVLYKVTYGTVKRTARAQPTHYVAPAPIRQCRFAIAIPLMIEPTMPQ